MLIILIVSSPFQAIRFVSDQLSETPKPFSDMKIVRWGKNFLYYLFIQSAQCALYGFVMTNLKAEIIQAPIFAVILLWGIIMMDRML